MFEPPAPESWTAKILYVVAFLVSGAGTYFLMSLLHDRMSVAYRVFDNPLLGVLVGLVLAAPVFLVEDRFLLRLTGRGLTNNPRSSSIRPVSMGIFIGCFLPYIT